SSDRKIGVLYQANRLAERHCVEVVRATPAPTRLLADPGVPPFPFLSFAVNRRAQMSRFLASNIDALNYINYRIGQLIFQLLFWRKCRKSYAGCQFFDLF
ncbi:MAG: hypothetical protein LIO96_01980, partial [Lachnospiraceae bacterium]|nr:hypothetical protein [Lachnospiraceae bacterium]